MPTTDTAGANPMTTLVLGRAWHQSIILQVPGHPPIRVRVEKFDFKRRTVRLSVTAHRSTLVSREEGLDSADLAADDAA